MLFALDPGPERSTYVRLTPDGSISAWTLENRDMLYQLRIALSPRQRDGSHLVIEEIQSYGMPVGREVFETVFWSGRFAEAWPGTWSLLPRRAVKLALCGTARATDATIRQAVIDRYGSTRAAAIGTKKSPGPLYGIKGDAWQALALALAYQEVNRGTTQDTACATTDHGRIDPGVRG